MININNIKLSECFIVKCKWHGHIYKTQLIGFTKDWIYIRNIDLYGKMLKPENDDDNNSKIKINAFNDWLIITSIIK